MTPAQVKAWQDQHGGPGDPPSPPDSQGLVTHRAADGAWMVVGPNGLVSQGPSPGVVDGSPGVAGDASSAPAGQGMSQQQVQTALASIAPGGDAGKLEYRESQQKRTVTDTSGLNPTKVTKDVPVRVWYDPATGRSLKFDLNDDGSFTQTFSGIDKSLIQPAARGASADPTTPQGRAAAANATTAEIRAARGQKDAEESAANAALPADQDPRYETNTQRQARAQATIRQQGIDARANDADQERKDAAARQAAAASRPTTVATNTTEPYIVQAGPDGTLTTTENPNYQGEKPQRSTVKGSDGKTYVVSVDKDGNATSKAVEGLPPENNPNAYAAEPAGAPPFVDVPGQITQGLRTYSAWLDQQTTLWKSSGGKQGVSPDDATKLMDRRLAQANAVAQEHQQQTTNQSTARGQDITQRGQTLQDTNGRRTTADSLFRTAIGMLDQAKSLGPGGAPLLNKAINDTLQAGLSYVNAFGGLKTSPEVPSVGFLNQAQQQASATSELGRPGDPPLAAAQPAGMPYTPDQAGVLATNEANRRQYEAAHADAPGAQPAVSGPPPPLGQGQDISTLPASGVNPPVGDPSNNPTQPVGMTLPVAVNPIDTSPITPPPDPPGAPAPGAPGTPPMPRFLQEARYGPGSGFDSQAAAAAIAQRLGIDPAIMQAAHQGLYG